MTPPSKNKRPEGQESSPTHGETDFAKDPLSGKIGNSLKRMYEDVLNEDVPDDFLSLLIKADERKK